MQKPAKKSAAHLPNGIVAATSKAKPIHVVSKANYKSWLKRQNKTAQKWLANLNYQPGGLAAATLPGANGDIAGAIVTYDELSVWTMAGLPLSLPPGSYAIANQNDFTGPQLSDLCLGWSMGAYQFTRYKRARKTPASLAAPKNIDAHKLSATSQAVYLIRDMVNTPAEDMGPENLGQIATNMARQNGGKIKITVGDQLLTQNYPLIHAVGRAAPQEPRLIDLTWGNPKHKKLVLVGKGVCFDTGGLDIKNDANMLIMKKDMGGAAHALGLAHMIMQLNLPVNLRVMIAAVENSIASNAFRPLDIIKSRQGMTVEIGNTDAEGRLVMADCLWEGSQAKPDMMIDFSTLTGAARVALGPELPALFSNDDALLVDAIRFGRDNDDPMWPMPLWKNYRTMLDSKTADINNSSNSSFAGCITAALFLQEFVLPGTSWIHLDLYAWNANDRPGRPQGGEAMTIRGLFSLLQARYKHG